MASRLTVDTRASTPAQQPALSPSSKLFSNGFTASHLKDWHEQRATAQDRQQFATALSSAALRQEAHFSRASTPGGNSSFGSGNATKSTSRFQSFADKPTWHYSATSRGAHPLRTSDHVSSARTPGNVAAPTPSSPAATSKSQSRPPPSARQLPTTRDARPLQPTRPSTTAGNPSSRLHTPAPAPRTPLAPTANPPATAAAAAAPRTWVNDPALSQYRMAYCTAELAPDTYKQAVALARSRPADPGTFKSAWAESLQKGAQELRRLSGVPTSTYSMVNSSVHKAQMATQLQAENQFYDWVARQKLYYGEVLRPDVASAVSEVMRQATPEARAELLGTFRKMKAAVSIHELQSTNHADYQVVQPLLSRR